MAAAAFMQGELGDPHPINEAVETLRNFSETCEMILQLRKPLCDHDEVLITTREFRAEILSARQSGGDRRGGSAVAQLGATG
jgi:hypothetical protein